MFYLRYLFVYLGLMLVCSSINAREELVFSTGSEAAIQEISEIVLREAYHKLGYTIRVERFPNPRSLIMSNSGQYDGELSRIEGIEKEFSNLVRVPVAINKNEGFAFMNTKDISISDWESLRAYRLVCVLGVQVIKLALADRNIACEYVATHEQALKMLQLKRVDVAVMPKINGLSVLQESEITGIYLSDEPLITMDLYHYLHQKNAHILPALMTALKEMQASGRLLEIRKAYIDAHQLR